jgi:hypothetical protein
MFHLRCYFVVSFAAFLILAAQANLVHAQDLLNGESENLLVELTEKGVPVEQIPVSVTTRTNSEGVKEVTYSKGTQTQSSRKITIDIELGASNSLKNDVRIPNEGGTLFSLKNSTLAPTFRAYFTWAINAHHSIRVLYAPFSATQEITPDRDIVFNGLTYLAGNPVEAYYQFNSYRIGYIYSFDPIGDTVFRVGFTNKIRDARIGLGPNASSMGNGFDDLGYVPLIHLGAQYRFLNKRAFADLEMEGLASPGAPGRAFDVSAQVGIPITKNTNLSAGYRFVEGGADVNIYNFTFLQSFFTRLTYSIPLKSEKSRPRR